ncbi:MAG: ABC transporter permease subunit [Chloroflexi bacterium]|nr:ABC transporter permease subunit [Chloroflexota bacterium]MCY3937483.1 ABC transporter permease subunit [Chloroflexota bacterium]
MITDVLKLTKWEWNKLRRRRMPWILLAIAIVISQISFWGGYAFYRSGVMLDQASFATSETQNGQTVEITMTCRDIEAGTLPPEIENLSEQRRGQVLEDIARFEAEACQTPIEARRDLREALVLPYSIGLSLGLVSSLGAILVVILASSTIGIEYGLGTLRTTLAKGIGRSQFIVSKALLLALLSAAALLVVSISIAISSTIAALTLGDAAVAADSGAWLEVAIVYGKTLYGLIPYIALAMFFAVLTSSSGVGTAIVLGYYFAERIVVALLFNFDWFRKVADFILGRAVDGWISSEGGLSIELGASAGELPDALHGFLVMLGYIVILGAFTFWLFQRRDIAGAKGD